MDKESYLQSVTKWCVGRIGKKTPKSDSGNKTARLHQSLTLDVGEPHLEKQLISVITLMNISDDWKSFLKLFGKKFQKDLIELARSADFKTRKLKNKSDSQNYVFDLFADPKEEQKIKPEEHKEPLSDFNTKLKTALNYNPKDK
nr:P63C domain-containing protein [Mucilaginibacter humi]